MAAEALSCLGEDVLRIYSTDVAPVTTAILDLQSEISTPAQDPQLLQVALGRRSARNTQRERTYNEAVCSYELSSLNHPVEIQTISTGRWHLVFGGRNRRSCEYPVFDNH